MVLCFLAMPAVVLFAAIWPEWRLDPGANMGREALGIGFTPFALWIAWVGIMATLRELRVVRAAGRGDAAFVARCIRKWPAEAVSGSCWCGVSPLGAAAQAGECGVIQLLLDAGVDPAARDAHGATALARAHAAGQVHAMGLLQDPDGSIPSTRVLGHGDQLAPDHSHWALLDGGVLLALAFTVLMGPLALVLSMDQADTFGLARPSGMTPAWVVYVLAHVPWLPAALMWSLPRFTVLKRWPGLEMQRAFIWAWSFLGFWCSGVAAAHAIGLAPALALGPAWFPSFDVCAGMTAWHAVLASGIGILGSVAFGAGALRAWRRAGEL